MKLIKYELIVVSEEDELPIEEALGSSDVVNSDMCSFTMKKVLETWVPFEGRSEEGEQTGSWYEKWYKKAGELLEILP